jgi:hypothetical protein
MAKEEKKDKCNKAESQDFECTPKDRQRMFEMMSKCCASGFSGCSSMMKAMKDQDCSPKTEKS